MDPDDRFHLGSQVHTGVQAVAWVVNLRLSSNFGGATKSGVYATRDCPQYLHIAAIACTGCAEFERGDR